MLRFIRRLLNKKPQVLGPYRGYIGSIEYNGMAGWYQGKILNIPDYWKDRIIKFPSLTGEKTITFDYSGYDKRMCEVNFKDKVDHLVEIIDSFWENQKTGK